MTGYQVERIKPGAYRLISRITSREYYVKRVGKVWTVSVAANGEVFQGRTKADAYTFIDETLDRAEVDGDEYFSYQDEATREFVRYGNAPEGDTVYTYCGVITK